MAWQICGEEAEVIRHVLCSLLPHGTLKSDLKTTARGAQPLIWASQHPCEPLDGLGSTTATQPCFKDLCRWNLFQDLQQFVPRDNDPHKKCLDPCSCVFVFSLWALLCLVSFFLSEVWESSTAGVHTQQAATLACWWAEQIALLGAFSTAQICVGFCILSNFLFFLTKHMSPDWRWVSVVQPLPKVKCLGLASWKAAWQRRTQGSWWRPSWPQAISVPLSQTRPTGSWAALGWSLLEHGQRRSFSSAQHSWDRPGVLCPALSPISMNSVLEQVPQRATKTTN